MIGTLGFPRRTERRGLLSAAAAIPLHAALLVVKLLLDYVSRHGFTPFAYWRILVGAAGLAGLIVYG